MGNKLRTRYLQWLLPYISEDDERLDKETFLRFLADRIHDDLSHKPNPPNADDADYDDQGNLRPGVDHNP